MLLLPPIYRRQVGLGWALLVRASSKEDERNDGWEKTGSHKSVRCNVEGVDQSWVEWVFSLAVGIWLIRRQSEIGIWLNGRCRFCCTLAGLDEYLDFIDGSWVEWVFGFQWWWLGWMGIWVGWWWRLVAWWWRLGGWVGWWWWLGGLCWVFERDDSVTKMNILLNKC